MPEGRPVTVGVVDVNETLLDIVVLEPPFERVFGDAAVLREWFSQLILYSQTLTLAGRYYSVEAVRQFKPAPAPYRKVAHQLPVEPSAPCLVSCHVWDTIGAQAAGCRGALVTRPHNATRPAADVPVTNLAAATSTDLTGRSSRAGQRADVNRAVPTHFSSLDASATRCAAVINSAAAHTHVSQGRCSGSSAHSTYMTLVSPASTRPGVN